MQRRVLVLLLLGALVCVPAIAQATVTITVGAHNLLPATAGQTIDIMISADEDYTDSNMRTTIATGGPVVTHVFSDTGGTIPSANMGASVWAGGSGGISGTPDGTSPSDSGRRTVAGFATSGFTPTQADGIYATLTLSTVGVAPGTYALSLNLHPNGPTDVFNGLDEFFEPIPVSSLVLVNGTLNVVPEPASVALALCGAVGLAFVAVRRRSRRAA